MSDLLGSFCPECGTPHDGTKKFCHNCGTKLPTLENTEIQVSNTQVPAQATANSSKKLLKVYEIPANVRKQFAKYLTLELYTDRLVGKGSKNGDIAYFFKNYMSVTWTPASVATQFAQIVFLTHENSGRYITGSNLSDLSDMNKIPFCSGMFSYATANEYTKSLYMDIKAALDNYKEIESQQAVGAVTVQSALSPADELKKFKELLDIGVITQEEFDAKKKQLLGL